MGDIWEPGTMNQTPPELLQLEPVWKNKKQGSPNSVNVRVLIVLLEGPLDHLSKPSLCWGIFRILIYILGDTYPQTHTHTNIDMLKELFAF